MSAWYCQVVLIEAIEKHPNADSLSIATVLGAHPVIIKTGEYEVGQAVAYFAIDTIVPDTEQFYFMSPVNRTPDGQILGKKFLPGEVPERYRVLKAKNIRGTFSMGLLVPAPDNFSVGDSVVEHFGLTKLEEEEEENIPSEKIKKFVQDENKPVGWSIPYYDLESLRRYHSCIEDGEEIVLTEKLNGSNGSFCHDGERLFCKSRKLYKHGIIEYTDGEGISHSVESTDQWWQVARRYDIENKLAAYPNIALFGEVYAQVGKYPYDGELVNGKYQPNIRFFDAYDTKTMRYLDYDDLVAMCNKIDLPLVPELYRGPWLGKEKIFPFAEGKTTLGGKHVIEGFVLKTVKNRFEPKLNSRLILKLVGEGYSLNK